MKKTHLVPHLVENVKTVAAVFGKGTREYTYKTDLELEKEQLVIVEAGSSFSIAQIVAIHDTPQIDINAKFEYKWVVSTLDSIMEKHRDLKMREMKFVDSLADLSGKSLGAIREDYGVAEL